MESSRRNEPSIRIRDNELQPAPQPDGMCLPRKSTALPRWRHALLTLGLFALCAALAACSSEPKKDYTRELPPGMMALQKITDPAEYPYFGSGFKDVASLLASIDESIAYFKKPSSKKYFPYLDISHDRAVASLQSFRDLVQNVKSGEELHKLIVERYDVYRSVGCDFMGTVLFTGYCTPIFEGSLQPDSVYKYPLYKLPTDVVKNEEGMPLGRKTPEGTVVSYYTREEIER
ncbi:MAG: MltA domain-containing protein, partial [Planctomycetota bacterium]|nr:MltA domain-containing protein [Planctomycetota bacterium]